MLTMLLAGAALSALALQAPKEAPTSLRTGLRRAADEILQHQASDGALTMSRAAPAGNVVVPYFANGAACGLADAYRVTRDPRCLDAANRWIEWYERHMNADGTVYDYQGTPEAWQSTGKYDSTDSYASTYMEAVLAVAEARLDAAWLARRAPKLRLALAAIRLTLDPRGLTRAHPKWDWMYAMDNVEVARGLAALAAAAERLKDAPLKREATTLRAGLLEAIQRELWSPALRGYRVGVMPNGAVSEGLTQWYPGQMANLMAVAWLPPSRQNAELYDRLKAVAPPPAAVTTVDELDRAVWWLWATTSAGDRTTRPRLQQALAAMPTDLHARCTVGYPGHIARLLSRAILTDARRPRRD